LELYNNICEVDDVDKEEKSGEDSAIFLNSMRIIYALGVRNIIIVVDGEDVFRKSDILFVEPKESPLDSGLTMNESFRDWKTVEEETTLGQIQNMWMACVAKVGMCQQSDSWGRQQELSYSFDVDARLSHNFRS
jgi:hypothetical protein